MGRTTRLVLTRKIGESVKIGDDITVTVIRNGRGEVRLEFLCPVDLAIVRTELLEIKREASNGGVLKHHMEIPEPKGASEEGAKSEDHN